MNNFDDFRKLNPDIRTLPQVFRENAYYTASIGKVFHIGPTTPVDLKSWDSCLEWKGTDEMRDTKGKSRNPSNGQLPWCNWKQVEQGKLWDDYITETTIHQLEQNADSPFFIAAGLYKPHDPFCAPKEFFDLYSLEELELPKVPQDASVLPEGITSASVDTIMWNEAYQDMSDNDKLELMQAYYACISYMDSNIGKILDTLKRLKLDDNTIVILIGDHGYHVWEKDWFGKTTVFERSARAPMLISVPDMSSKGKRCERVVEFLDIFPTLTTLCDIEPPASVQGRSLVPLLEEPAKISEDWKGAGYTCFTSDNWSVRTNRWRYIEWNVTYGGKALYDHFKDEGEHYNLVNYPEYAPVVEKLRNMLFSVRGNQGDSGDK
jgi:arylsulfatase A-like enzyme